MFRILVVDNSDDVSGCKAFAEEVRGRPGLEVAYSSPPGLSRARNAALERCETEFIAYIDDDALPSPEWLASILDAFRKSDVSVVAGPIEPVWPGPKPDWLPDKYLGCLTILDHGPADRMLSEYEFAYGTNMAFRVGALREVGGFNVGLGRIGGRTLISDEEIETQLALHSRRHKRYYAAAAKVRHKVHENRLSRNYFRARMAWQAVSTLMHDSPLWWPEQSRQEIIRASAELGVSEFVRRLFSSQDAAAFSAQIDLIYHLFLITLDSNNENDAVFERMLSTLAETRIVLPAPDCADAGGAMPYAYRGAAPVRLETNHLFIDSPSSHAFLFDVYADIPGSQMMTFSVNLWDKCDEELEYLENSLSPQIQTLTFATLEPFIYGPRWPAFHDLLQRLKIPVYGILHRLPWTNEQAALLHKTSNRARIIVLAEGMVDRLRDSYGITNVLYLPLHPTHSLYIGQEGKDTRRHIGVLPEQFVFSVLGEARRGKGIELLLSALDYVAPEDRERLFFLFAGRAKDINARNVENQLAAKRCDGYVDLRQSADPLNYAVLTEQELGRYINVSDVGILLYQEDQRNCMSGVLPNYAWGRKPVIVTSDSIVGDLVRRYNLGLALTKETPRSVAEALTSAVRLCRTGQASMYSNESYRATIAAKAVVERFAAILDRKINPGIGSRHDIAGTRRPSEMEEFK
jgi:glycosyltransferase involved in cell wall biosynthesis